jgi:hypothetical protein
VKRIACTSLVLAVLLVRPASLHAQFFKDLVKAAGGAVNTATKVVTAPAATVINAAGAVVGANDASAIFRPYSDLGKAAGGTVAAATNLVSNPSDFLYQQALAVASKTGAPGKFVFDVGTFQYNLTNQLVRSGGYAAASILSQQNPLQLTAAPLAAAIRAARERHSANAQPLPPDVLQGLAPYFSPSVLARARFAVGTVEITLPSLIGNGARFLSGDYAVVVDDIIVFNTQPPSFSASPGWWVHEMTHVRQYQTWGVDRFAWEYLRTFGSEVEGEANSQAAAAQRAATSAAGVSSMSMSGTGILPAAPFGAQGQVATAFQSEYFVAQCVFANQAYYVHILVTNTNRVIMTDATNGQWSQIGWATPPLLPNVAWTLTTPNWKYAVGFDGTILTVNPYNQFVPIGYSRRLY